MPDELRFPTSCAQERLIFEHEAELDGSRYMIRRKLHLQGDLDPAALEFALDEITRRHEVLRTQFARDSAGTIQIVLPEVEPFLGLPTVDLRALGPVERAERLAGLLDAEARSAPDLSRAEQLFTKCLILLTERESVLLLSLHHAIVDGWSFGVLYRELASLYDAHLRGESSSLPELEIQYGDYAEWQRLWLEGDEVHEHLEYWRAYLAGAPERLGLPLDGLKPECVGEAGRSRLGEHGASRRLGAQLQSDIPAELVERLRGLAREEGVTLFVVLLSALKLVLSRFSNQQDVVVGTTVANRTHSLTGDMIGNFVNLLPLRTDVRAEPSFRQLLRRVNQGVVAGIGHQALPFEQLVAAVRSGRDAGERGLVDVVFDLELPLDPPALSGLDVRESEIRNQTAKFDLLLSVADNPDPAPSDPARHAPALCAPARCVWEYDRTRFHGTSIARISSSFATLLARIAENPDFSPADPWLVPAAERSWLLDTLNNTRRSYPRDICLHRLFEEQVERNPLAPALVEGDTCWSYRELDRFANRVARRLLDLGIRAEQRVGLCMPRGAAWVASVLGILKAGGSYLPLDPADPPERLARMARDSQVRLVLTLECLRERATCCGVDVLSWEETGPSQSAVASEASEEASPPSLCVPAEALAYVMYTSGSSGAPKAVGVTHRAVARLVLGVDYVDVGEKEVSLLLAPTAFDASTFELWAPLLNGGRLVIQPDALSSFDEFRATLERNRITTLWLTAGLFNQLVEHDPAALGSLRQLLVGGEALSPRHVSAYLEHNPGGRLINGYGPTEVTTFSCSHRVAGPEFVGQNIPIGRPISNTRVYLLDAGLALVPVGAVGELFIAGDGLARGYLDHPGMTAERFLPDPFANEPGSRMYRSGDFARLGPNDELEFLGRVDAQLKIRGYRVEPEEIEEALGAHPTVAHAAVRGVGSSGDKTLVAYVVPAAGCGLDARLLRAFLVARLPGFMIPSQIREIAELPLNRNGKLDRGALPEPDFGAPIPPQGELPSTPSELAIAKIWRETLGIDEVALDQNFFELGGHSILALKLLARVSGELASNVGLHRFLAQPTLRGLLLAMAEQEHTEASAIRPRERVGKPGGTGVGVDGARVEDMSDAEVEAMLAALQSPEAES